MFPPVFANLKDDSAVKAIFGDDPRVFPHGIADQKTPTPYAVWQVVTGSPENYLGNLPDMDKFITQIDVYAQSAASASAGAKAIRDALEPVAHVDGWGGQFKEQPTGLNRFSFYVAFQTPRVDVPSSGGVLLVMPSMSLFDGHVFSNPEMYLWSTLNYHTDEFGNLGYDVIPLNVTTVTFDPVGPITLGALIPADPYGTITINNNLVAGVDDETIVEITVTATYQGETIVQKRRVTVVPI